MVFIGIKRRGNCSASWSKGQRQGGEWEGHQGHGRDVVLTQEREVYKVPVLNLHHLGTLRAVLSGWGPAFRESEAFT